MRKSSVLLGIISVTCAFSAVWSWQQLRLERQNVAELERRLAASPAAPVQHSTAPAPVIEQHTPATTLAPVGAAAAPADADTLREKEVRDHIRASQQRQREMMRDPAYRKTAVEQVRQQLAPTRADAIRVVGMTAEQADRVIELWVERNLRYAELVDGGKSPSEAAQAEMKRASDAEQAELRNAARRGEIRKVDLVPGERTGTRRSGPVSRAALHHFGAAS